MRLTQSGYRSAGRSNAPANRSIALGRNAPQSESACVTSVRSGEILWSVLSRCQRDNSSLTNSTTAKGARHRPLHDNVCYLRPQKCHGSLPAGLQEGLCSENYIPDFGRSSALDAKLAEYELTFPDPMHQFNASDGDRGAPKTTQALDPNKVLWIDDPALSDR
jgi:hypothetical protein